MMKEEELKTQVACYADHLLKYKRENKGKPEQLEYNYELIKHFYTYTHTHTYLPLHRYLAATSMNSTTKPQNFRHLQCETYALKHREIKIMTDSYSQQALLAIPTPAVLCFYLYYLSKVPIDSHYKWALIIASKSLRKCRHTYQNHSIISFIPRS